MMHMDLVFADGTKTRIGLEANALGSGADAAVYRIADHPDLAAKVYHDPDKDPHRPEKIRAMMATPPDLPAIRNNGMRYHQTAWPAGMLFSPQGMFAGYAMPFVDLKHSTVLENLLAEKSRQLLDLPDFYGFRVSAAANLASLVAALHQCGHHIIDLKPVNINVYTDTFYTALLDCDGLSIQGTGGRRFAAHQYTEGYIAPEAMQQNLRPQELDEYQDRFALAVIIFQLLNQGIHPYQGAPAPGFNVPPTTGERILAGLYAYGIRADARLKPSPWSMHTFLEDDTRRLFDRAFGGQALSRPPAEEWKAHLHQLLDIDKGLLQRCSRDSKHAHFSKGCGFCVLEKRQAQARQHQPQGVQTQQAYPTQGQPAGSPQAHQTPSTKPASGFNKILLSIFLIIALLYGGQRLYSKFNNVHNVHNVIQRNDIERFKSKVKDNDFEWSEITRDDFLMALNFPDGEILSTLIAYQPASLPTDYEFFTRLIDSNHSDPLESYERTIHEKLRHHQKNSVGDLMEALLLSGKLRYVEAALRCQISPDWEVSLYNPAHWQWPSIKKISQHLLSSIVTSPCNMVNYHWFENKGSPTLQAVMNKFGKEFRIPADRSDLMVIQMALHNRLKGQKIQSDQSKFPSFRWGVRPIHIAALNDDEAYLRLLINSGADLDATSFDGRRAEQLTQSGQIYTMLKIGRKKLSPFYMAIAKDNTDQFKAFMKEPFRARLRKGGPDPFEFAVDHGSLGIVDMFYHQYGKKFDPDDIDLLVRAYHSQNPMLLAYLLEKGSNLNNRLSLSKKAQMFDQRQSLFDQKQSLFGFAQTYDEYSTCHFGSYLKERAEIDGRWDVILILEAYRLGWQPLHYAAVRQDLEQIESIVKADPKMIHTRDEKGRTPLILAGYYDCDISMRKLIEFGSDITHEDYSGYTVLHYAAYSGNKKMVKALLPQYAGPLNKDDPICQPPDVTVQNRYEHCKGDPHCVLMAKLNERIIRFSPYVNENCKKDPLCHLNMAKVIQLNEARSDWYSLSNYQRSPLVSVYQRDGGAIYIGSHWVDRCKQSPEKKP